MEVPTNPSSRVPSHQRISTLDSHDNDGSLRMYFERSPLFAEKEEARVVKFSNKDQISNPAPLGLLGFAITTALLQGAVNGTSGVETVTWATAFAIGYGGLAQVIAGILDFQRTNQFGGVAFTTYGCFWFSFAAYQVLIKAPSATAGVAMLPSSIDGEAFMLSFMGCITLAFFACTIAMNGVLMVLFGSLACLFFFLVGGLYNNTCKKFAGWFGFWVAGVAFYAACAELLNTAYNTRVLPMFTRRVKQHKAGASPDMLSLPGQQPYKYHPGEDRDVEGGRTAVVP